MGASCIGISKPDKSSKGYKLKEFKPQSSIKQINIQQIIPTIVPVEQINTNVQVQTITKLVTQTKKQQQQNYFHVLDQLDTDREGMDEFQEASYLQIIQQIQFIEQQQEETKHIRDTINDFYFFCSEQSESRSLPSIFNYVLSRKMTNNPNIQNYLVRYIEQQNLKWFSTAVIISLIDFDDLQLFHQNFNLIRNIESNKNSFKFSEKEGFKSLKLQKTASQQQKKKYSIEQMQKGIKIFGLFIKVINYHRYQTLLNKFLELKSQSLSNQNILQLIYVYKGVCFYVTPLRNDIKTQKVSIKTTEFLTPLLLNQKMKQSNPFESKKQYKNYYLFNVPENIQEDITYQHIKSCDYMGQKLKNFIDILKLNHIKLEKGDLKCLAFVENNQSINQRASKIIQLFNKQQVSQKGNVKFLFKYPESNIVSINRHQIYQKIINSPVLTTFSDLRQKIGLVHINQYFEIVTHQKFQTLSPKIKGLILTYLLIDSIKFYLYNSTNYNQLLKIIYEVLNFEAVSSKEILNFYISLKFIYCQSNSVKAHTELVMTAGYKYCLQFFQCVSQMFGINLGQFLIKIKKDSNYIIYNLPELRESKKLTFNLLLKQSYSLRNYIYSVLYEFQNEKLLINGKMIQINNPIGKIGKFYLNSLDSLQKWCNKIQNLFLNFRSILGQQQFVIQPYLIKLIVQIFMQHPGYYATLRKLQSLFNSLVLCTPELAISAYTLFALGYQKHELGYSEQCYVKGIGIIHRTYCDPRSRGNIFNSFQTFLLARLRNIKLITKKDTEVEFLEQMLQCCRDATQDYPFPPFKTLNNNNQSLHSLVQWFFNHLPIFHRSNIFYFKKQSISLGSAIRSNFSNQSKSSNAKKDRTIWQTIEKSSEASLDIESYNGIITFGNCKKTTSINPIFRNLTVVRISCGLAHIILSTTDSIYGCGDNTSKQLGQLQGKGLRKMYESDVPATSLSCGSEHSAAIIKGCLKMWGQKQGGIISGDGCYFDQIYCGGLHSIALKAGEVYSWGRGEGGQLGHPLQVLQTKKGAESTQYFLSKPKRINGLKNIKKVACGDAHTLVLTQTGKVFAFGFSYQGQLGLGLTGQSQRFQIFEPQIVQFKDEIINISAGSTWSVFITKKNQVFTCGLNDFHQLGIDKAVKVIQKRKEKSLSNTRRQKRGEIQFSVPNKMQYFSQNFQIQNISCGENHSIAKVNFNNQNLYVGWGMNKYQQLGIQNCQSTTPRIIPSLQKLNITEISCGSTFTIGLIGDKKISQKISVKKLQAENRQNLNKWKIIKSCF